MRYSLVLIALLSWNLHATANQMNNSMQSVDEIAPMDESIVSDTSDNSEVQMQQSENQDPQVGAVLEENKTLIIDVVGQGVAPVHTASPAQAYALAKRAAIADAYRLIAEKVKGVRIDGQDLIRNMMVKRSTVRTSVQAMVRNANIIETTFKDGLCEVEMEIVLSYDQFAQ